jgi:peptidoglycan/xylan/chitin deacetylase (PgdA/CDA1 family)
VTTRKTCEFDVVDGAISSALWVTRVRAALGALACAVAVTSSCIPSDTHGGYATHDSAARHEAAADRPWWLQGCAPLARKPHPFSEALISITFDDGWDGEANLALPALDARGLSATFYLTTSFVLTGRPDFMSLEQARSLVRHGHEIGDHSRTHPNLAGLDLVRLHEELAGSRDELIAALGAPEVVSFATPSGASSDDVVLESRTDFDSERSVVRGENFLDSDPYALKSNAINAQVEGFVGFDGPRVIKVQQLIDAAVQHRTWLILHFHQIVDDTPVHHTDYAIADFNDVLDRIVRSGARVVTVREGRDIQRSQLAGLCQSGEHWRNLPRR